jgi:hypothetical protein
VLHLGDLTINKEFDLMCPANRLGTVDLWIVSRHGQPSSNSAVLTHAIEPRVAVINNGTRKGGRPDAMKVIFSAPRLEDIWQTHFSQLGGQEYTVPGAFIANTLDTPETGMPRGFIAFLDSISEHTADGFLSDHPPLRERLLQLFTEIQYLPEQKNAVSASGEFRRIQQRLTRGWN